MRQNAPNPISISIFPGVTPPDPRYWGLCPRAPGKGGRGWDGRGGKEAGGGREGEGEVCVIAVGGDRRPWLCYPSNQIIGLHVYRGTAPSAAAPMNLTELGCLQSFQLETSMDIMRPDIFSRNCID